MLESVCVLADLFYSNVHTEITRTGLSEVCIVVCMPNTSGATVEVLRMVKTLYDSL